MDTRRCPHSGTYTSAVPDQMCPLLLRLARSCSLHFGFSMQQCVQPLNSQFAIVKIFTTIWLFALFCPDQRGELVITGIMGVNVDQEVRILFPDSTNELEKLMSVIL